MSDEQANRQHPHAESGEEAEILAALDRARQAAAEGRVYTVEEAREELAIRTAIRRAEQELDSGQGIPHDEVARRIANLRSASGSEGAQSNISGEPGA